MSSKKIFLFVLDKFYYWSLSNFCYHKTYNGRNERPLEYVFVLDMLMKHKASNILDVGTGKSCLPSLLNLCHFNVTASDSKDKYWSDGFVNTHYPVVKDDICNTGFNDDSFDAVVCISTLEHIADFNNAVHNMIRITKDGGILLLSFPYSHDQFVENVYDLPSSHSSRSNYITRSFSDKIIDSWCQNYNLLVCDKKYFRAFDGKFFTCGDSLEFPVWVERKEDANGLCICFKKKQMKDV